MKASNFQNKVQRLGLVFIGEDGQSIEEVW